MINHVPGRVDITGFGAPSENMNCYEKDHLILPEDRGDPTNAANLWPEPYNARVGGMIISALIQNLFTGLEYRRPVLEARSF